MTECECKSYTPFAILLLIPVFLLLGNHDQPKSVENPVNYQPMINSFIQSVSSYGYMGFIGFIAIMGFLAYRSWHSYHKQLAMMLLLTIPLYYWFFMGQVSFNTPLLVPNVINQTGVSTP